MSVVLTIVILGISTILYAIIRVIVDTDYDRLD